ncbi:MAG: hypothetical protein N0C84_14925, partial [Candidatus Thiodiazotropha taylori]|nr:hypothetical protein [Candidatus Thiodiazotropha taylori]MCW4257754.1 hypothetical protein [Candidatus Thiodiazotropha taylori]
MKVKKITQAMILLITSGALSIPQVHAQMSNNNMYGMGGMSGMSGMGGMSGMSGMGGMRGMS